MQVTTFQVLTTHICLVATVLDSATLRTNTENVHDTLRGIFSVYI